uniref:TMV resistance protein N-like isoform X2 n=1 Tax=Cicer arietinum TaxID=3827 RepID=A0A1S3EGE8_CICAR|nr:TMV resistance protein N-like isoform X2 [Cicer arietinum]
MYSSSSSKPRWIHDVFINFRGEDIRKTFVSHLYAVLSNSGINTFLDSDKLEKGEDIGHELLQAISVSHVSIIVFSKKYSESSWCLNELDKIMECRRTQGQIVLPVFYDVDPSVVRHQKGDFGKALEVAAKSRYIIAEVMEKVLCRWKVVLTEASNLSGWDGSAFRSDRELVKKIVEAILPKLDSTTLSITEFPVGLESHVKQVVQLIEKQPGDVCMVGIWGMGGSGKTTVAKAIYNQTHRTFECTSFIENIREVCEKDTRGYIHLQQQLISDVLKTKEKIHSIALGTARVQKVLSGKKALVVLDDVTEFQQIKALCGNHNFFGSGSVLIVTTRDVHILKLLKVDSVYEMKEMHKSESLELFCWHAFRKASPIGGFSDLSRNVVAYCGGLPLALEVLGSFLFERTKQEWISVLLKLERIPNDQVHEKLRISYDGLKDDMEKDIFLDICCFFIGKDRAYVTEILNGCGLYADIGIAVLIDRSLLKVEKNNKLGMHDLIRDMGREIVRESSAKEPGKRCRLWFHEDVHDVLTKNTGTETVEGLILNLQRTGRVSFSTNVFQDMKKLRLLQLDRVDLTGDLGYLSKQLSWVNWQRSTFRFIPDDFDQRNLNVFELKYSNVKQVWKEAKLLQKLKILNLSHSKYLKSTPDFTKLPNLEKLIIKDCQSLSNIHLSIGDLKNILLINLKDCTSLGNLPRVIYQLASVKTLILSGCSKIDKLEEDIVQMESLTTLIAAHTGVKQVPFSIIRSKNIGYISLCGFEGLSRDIFPPLIWSWMSPTMNSVAHIPPFGGMSMSLVSIDVDSNNLGLVFQSPILSSCSKLRSVWVQCHSEIQLKQELRRFLYDLIELEISHASQISDPSLKSILIEMGKCQIVNNTFGKSLSQGLTTDDSSASFLPGNNYPSWLTYTCEGPSVYFQVPEDSVYDIQERHSYVL